MFSGGRGVFGSERLCVPVVGWGEKPDDAGDEPGCCWALEDAAGEAGAGAGAEDGAGGLAMPGIPGMPGMLCPWCWACTTVATSRKSVVSVPLRPMERCFFIRR